VAKAKRGRLNRWIDEGVSEGIKPGEQRERKGEGVMEEDGGV